MLCLCQEHQSTLVGPTEITALQHILNKSFSARQLMQVHTRPHTHTQTHEEKDTQSVVTLYLVCYFLWPCVEHYVYVQQVLSSAGTNFFPAVDADKYVSVTSKVKLSAFIIG